MILSDTLGKMIKAEEEILYYNKLNTYYRKDADGSET